ncbi:MAG: carboxypeptidase regulatory-like domain-containing protein [Planctomycetes bacterium]|nr:carboxypeptidase regulatory-like domain-containing protein [Planctomycetota bacterium]
MVYDAGNGPAPVVAAPELEPEPLSAALPENKPLEAVQADKPAPEPQPAMETVAPASEPAPVLATDKPPTDPRLEAMRAELAEALERADLTEAEKKLQLEKLELALEAMQAQLGKAITIKGRVTDWAGQPVAGAKICAAITRDAAPAGGEKNESKRRRVSSTSMTAVLGTSDAQGYYTGTYQGVSEGPVELRLYAQAANYLPSPTQTLSATSGETYENIDFSLPQGAGISGRVVDKNFNPVANARVFAMQGGNMDRRRSAIASYSAFTDEQGCFSIGGMLAGCYSISVQCTGYTMQEKAKSIDVVEGSPTPLAADIVLNIATAVKLKLTSAGGTPKGYFTVNFFTADGKSRRGAGMADADGVALVVNVPEDAVELQVTMRGYKVSERIRFSVFSGTHSDAGEVALEVVEEQGNYDGKTPPPPGTGSLEETERRLKELEKLRRRESN